VRSSTSEQDRGPHSDGCEYTLPGERPSLGRDRVAGPENYDTAGRLPNVLDGHGSSVIHLDPLDIVYVDQVLNDEGAGEGKTVDYE